MAVSMFRSLRSRSTALYCFVPSRLSSSANEPTEIVILVERNALRLPGITHSMTSVY